MRSHSSYLFDIGQSLLLDFGSLVRSHSSRTFYLFHTGQSLLVDFGLCAPTRVVFLTLVSHGWWTLTCALPHIPHILSFSHWSVTVGGLWLVRSHSSCLFDIGQPLLADFVLCAPTRLVFLTLVRYCWWTLACAPPHSSYLFDIGQVLLVDFGLCAPTCLVFLTWYAWRHLAPCDMLGDIDHHVICMETFTSV